MGCAHKQNQNGFTLVEISIVMIIVGLLIGGTFGGMKLIENMQVNKTVQDLKAIDSAALTFRDTYGRLPGDMPNTAARLPNCSVAPCATGGNGDRILDVGITGWTDQIVASSERFTFWHHLQAANLVSMGTNNTIDMNFGEGQPESPLEGGYRMSRFSGLFGCSQYTNTIAVVTQIPSNDMNVMGAIPCQSVAAVDRKIDDGLPWFGKIVGSNGCDGATAACTSPPWPYPMAGQGYLVYDARF